MNMKYEETNYRAGGITGHAIEACTEGQKVLDTARDRSGQANDRLSNLAENLESLCARLGFTAPPPASVGAGAGPDVSKHSDGASDALRDSIPGPQPLITALEEIPERRNHAP